MKPFSPSLLLALGCVGSTVVLGRQGEAQTLDLFVNGAKTEVEIGKEVDAVINGQTLKLRLERKEITSYSDDFVSFSYPGSLEIAKKELNSQSTQLFLASATGSLIIVQEYQARNPADLTDLMIQTITKSDVSQGFTVEQASSARRLKSGKDVRSVNVTTSRGPRKHFYTFTPYGDDRRGIFIVTRASENDRSTDEKIFTTFWSSVSPKF